MQDTLSIHSYNQLGSATFEQLLLSLPQEVVDKMLHIERLRLQTEQDLYVVAGQIYSLQTHPIDSWTLFRWMQEHDVPSRFLIRRESVFYQTIQDRGQTKDVVALDSDCLHNELLDETELLTRAKAFIVEWRTDSAVDAWLQHLPGCRYVFLQHGITGTCVTESHKKVVEEEYNDINISSEYQINLLTDDEAVRRKFFIAGLPRYDDLITVADQTSEHHSALDGEATVFVMPTWRSRLKDKEVLLSSDYYNGLQALCSSENVERLRQAHIRMVFSFHHMIADNINLPSMPNIQMVDTQEDVAYWIRHAQALVTDFSSVSFDFLFQQKPVIFWIPDKDDPQLNHDDPQDGGKVDSALRLRHDFPNTVDTVEEVIEQLLTYVQKDFKLEEEKVKMCEKFFDYHSDFSQRVFDTIQGRAAQEQEDMAKRRRLYAAAQQPELSVIVPAYNVDRFLSRCMDSLIHQTDERYEVIVVDDGSTDYTPQLCCKYSFVEPRFRFVRQQNAGVSVARNKGIELARGKYISFVDADDWVTPDYVATLLSVQPDVDLLFFGNNQCKADGTRQSFLPGETLATDVATIERTLYHMSVNDCWYEFFGYTWNKRFRRDIIMDHHIRFQEGLALREDELFTERYTRHIRSLATINAVIYNYRFSYGGLTYRFHPGSEVLLLAQQLHEATEGIHTPLLRNYKKCKVFHYLFTATLNINHHKGLEVFEQLYDLYHGDFRGIRPGTNKRQKRRYRRIFDHPRWMARIIYLVKRKLMKKKYRVV